MVRAQGATSTTAPLAVVKFPAEIDIASACRVSEDLLAAFAPGVTIVIADMTATSCCDSLGIGVLVRAHMRAIASGAELRVVASSAWALQVLAILGLDRWLALYPNLQEALPAKAAEP